MSGYPVLAQSWSRTLTLNALSSLLVAFLVSTPAVAQDFARGQALYENHCAGACHNIGSAPAKTRKAKSYKDLRSRIKHWAGRSGLPWTKSEYDDVAFFLSKSYYHFKKGLM